jgi:hypothetical protein
MAGKIPVARFLLITAGMEYGNPINDFSNHDRSLLKPEE